MNSYRLAKIISYASSPFLVLPAFALIVVAFFAESLVDLLVWYGLFLGLTVGIPFAYIVHGLASREITDLHVRVRQQRLAPYLLAIIGSMLLAVAYKSLGVPDKLFVMTIMLIVMGSVFTAITYYWKASAHAGVFGGALFMVAGLVGPQWLWLALFLPAIIWARFREHRHSVWQGIAATAFAGLCVLVTLRLLQAIS